VLAGDGLPESGTDLVTLFIVVRRAVLGSIEGHLVRHTHWPVWRWTCRKKTLATDFASAQATAGFTHNLTHGDCDG
jgi:hypothetical protein